MKLYTKTVCPKCILIKTMLGVINVDYEAVNIDNDEKAKNILLEQGIMSVPVLEVDGKFVSSVPEIQSEIRKAAEKN